MNCTMEKSKIQMLYDACNDVFSQKELPTFQQIQWLKSILNIFEAADVGIDEFSLDGSPSSSPKITNGLISGQGVSEITYIHIHECDNFSMGIFCFPAGRTLPLHDHPGMTVLSKLLYGSVYVKAYDWVQAGTNSPRTNGLAGTVINGIFNAPCESSVLFPRSGGNIHSFTALTPCAILDVLSPPYSDDFERPSTYFFDFPIPSLPGYALLEERELKLPYDVVVNGAPYLGPPLDVGQDVC
ncbi:plant cysteine oxidase 1-like isoform X1 [Herrania umbratica]|uniref:cysteine dioxygenase n=1 Tax=Herrania umbratica TaxID=108875 RepID=A0A6J1AE62_9ROSI|nr:plant cysteine oxidase 1-like isoform X1 [Herrania umbratica]